jgi:hypothetical protein
MRRPARQLMLTLMMTVMMTTIHGRNLSWKLLPRPPK